MIRKSGYRFSEKIMLIEESGAKTNGARHLSRAGLGGLIAAKRPWSRQISRKWLKTEGFDRDLADFRRPDLKPCSDRSGAPKGPGRPVRRPALRPSCAG